MHPATGSAPGLPRTQPTPSEPTSAGSARGGGPPRRVLVVSFRFPPHGGGGVHRVAAFTKYLPRFGWRPHVLTGPWNPSRSLHDPSVLAKIPEGVPITRTGHLNTKGVRRLLRRLRLLGLAEAVTPTLPMMDAGWIPHGYREGVRLLEEENFDLIYSSAYPISSHVVAYLLSRRSGLPWVADYRDEWSIRSVLSWPTALHRKLARRIDEKLIGAADAVVTTSPFHTRTFGRAFPPTGNQRHVTITNGFDADDFAGAAPALSVPPQGDRFTLAHVGTFNAWRDADGLLAAMRRLIEEGRVPIDRIEFLFVGQTKGLEATWLRERGVLREVAYLPHPEAVGTMRAADTLLLMNTEVENILGKTFEYLASGRPIIGLLVEGATAELVREAGAGPVLDPGDVDGIAGTLVEYFEAWQAGSLRGQADPDVVRRYSRNETTERLAEVLDWTVAEHSRAPDSSGVSRSSIR
jgi:glycosyltransferase involved in cell wall biosynthesis